jgi:caffeoyl-CoA O-methyltransferase
MILSPELDEYCDLFSSPESELLKKIKLKTEEKFPGVQMISGPQMGGLLKFLIRLKKAKFVLEIGTYSGYSALSMAEAFDEMYRHEPHFDGYIMTIERARETLDFAQRFFDESSPLGEYIRPRWGEAPAIFDLLDREADYLFDLIFIDADKASVIKYYEWALRHLSPHGVMIVDDVLWYGKVLTPDQDKRAASMHAFNQHVQQDSRVSHVVLPIRHGVQLIQKKQK